MTEGYPALETYVAALSTGPVGPSDQIGTANKTLIMATWSVMPGMNVCIIIVEPLLIWWTYTLYDSLVQKFKPLVGGIWGKISETCILGTA